jgi:DNA polymerase epsilon subunit 1
LKPTTFVDQDDKEVAAVILYFIKEDGTWIKGIKTFEPYFYIRCDDEVVSEIIFYLSKTYEKRLKSIDIVLKEDLELVNHLSGKKGKFIKLSFNNVIELMEVKGELLPVVKKNVAQRENQEIYDFHHQREGQNDSQYLSRIYEIREYDVAYHIRTMIDNEIRCSFWYQVKLEGSLVSEIKQLPDKLDKADLRIFAFDIETTKAELKFPDSKFDQIMMISYIVDGNGFLITNRQVVAEDIQDFEYSPKPEYDVGVFKVFNEPDEKQLLVRFFEHIRETKPFIFTTFNGDFFDWPFIQDRAEVYKMKIEDEIGVYHATNGEMYGRFAPHLDCFYWVKRDAYLPQGSHGLKAVTKAKLGYDPVELDPELMLPYAQERP